MRIARTLAATLAICALAAPIASAEPPDMHNRLAATSAKQSQTQDLRSPDARDAATRSQRQDLRTPDTRDAALRLHRSGLTVGTYEPVAAAEPATAVPPAKSPGDDGVDWTTIALGIAGSLFAVVGVALVSSRRRMPPLRPSA